MQEASLLPLRPVDMLFSAFLGALFAALDTERVRFCVLRNYEGFPDINIGGDIDLLISQSDLPKAVRALRSVNGVRIVGFSERSWVAHAFVESVSATPEARSMQVDFLWNLSWKGLAYVPTDVLLESAVARTAGNLRFLVPSPVHEAITSLFASLLKSAWLKEKYFPGVQETFTEHRLEVISVLMPQFGRKNAEHLVKAVMAGDRSRMVGLVRPLRRALAVRSLSHKPIRSCIEVLRHYVREIIVRFSPASVETVCLIGLDQSRVAKLIEDLVPTLQYAAKAVESFKIDSESSSSRTPARPFASRMNIVRMLVRAWQLQFLGKKELTLRICAGSYDDLVIDPKRLQYAGPAWFAKTACALFPSPMLWILLDSREDASQGSDAYRALVTAKPRHAILDAVLPEARVVEAAYAAVVGTLALRTGKILDNRF